METTLLKLNDLLSKKETSAYSITGTTSDGTFRCLVEPEAKFKEDVTHYVYLKSFTGWSYFPNLDSSNNKFIYSTLNNTHKIITIPTGSYQISDYNNFIHLKIKENKEPIIKNEVGVIPSEEELKADPKDEYPISIFPYVPTS